MQHKLYIITRDDLSVSQKAVQSGHALAEFLLQNKSTTWYNGTLVYLKVSDENSLKRLTNHLKKDNIAFTEFKEPMFNNELTAIASLGSNKFFKNLILL